MQNNWYKESENSKVYWLDDPVTKDEMALSFDKVKLYYLPRDYANMTDEEREILDKETNNFWRVFTNYK